MADDDHNHGGGDGDVTNAAGVPGPGDEAVSLIDALLDGRLSPQGAARLEVLLERHAEVRRLYLRYLHQECVIARHPIALPRLSGNAWAAPDEPDEPDPLSSTDAMVMPAIHASPDDDDDGVAVAPPSYPRLVPPARRRRWWWAAAGGGAAAALVLAAAVWLTRPPPGPKTPRVAASRPAPPPIHAWVERAADARWAQGTTPAVVGGYVPEGALSLVSGLVEIRFLAGASAIVEGPADFTVQSRSQVLLRRGRLACRVPPEAVGFVVLTPGARVVDQGTEFGVHVGDGNATEVEVFEGKVLAEPGPAGSGPAAPPAELLTAGQAATVTPASVTLDPGGAVPQRFVRRLGPGPRVLDLVDLVAGGDGTTNRRGIAIDTLTGAAGSLTPIGDVAGTGRYSRVPGLTILDGTFVPDGRGGPVVIDSAGGTFRFAATSNRTFNHLWTGGAVPVPPGFQVSTVVNGVDYAAPGHGLIYTHSNKGFTIDLDAVRRLHPARELAAFSTTAAYGIQPNDPLDAKTDVLVLVDGQPRFERRAFTRVDASVRIDLALNAGDRFLTLAVTDGGDDYGFDGILWLDPAIELRDR